MNADMKMRRGITPPMRGGDHDGRKNKVKTDNG